MIDNGNFLRMRLKGFDKWWGTQRIAGIGRETFSAIFKYLLARQNEDGWWPSVGAPWSVVQTAVVLKSLAYLRFEPGDAWNFETEGQKVNGSIDAALNCLKKELERDDTVVGEDIWDTCQVLLAVDALGNTDLGETRANEINGNWQALYDHASRASPPNPWCGPAFLSAMIEVLHRYHARLANSSQASDIAAELVRKESPADCGTFPACGSGPDYNRWNTCLVLRTLGLLREAKYQPLIGRVSRWVLNEVEHINERGIDSQRRPMHLARCLEGLRSALPRVEPALVPRIQEALKNGNIELQKCWKADPRIGDLKSYTAVGEYLAGELVSVPAGLLFDIEKALRPQPQDGVRDTPGGLRIAWLSDLHLAEASDEQPFSMNLVKKFAIGFMYVKSNPLTQHYQSQNLAAILSEVESRKPNHILVTGDIANYAKAEQFQRAREAFFASQRQILGAKSPNTLERELWTILPGNHDASDEYKAPGKIRCHLGEFFRQFADAYDGSKPGGYDDLFPYMKSLVGKQIRVKLVVLDSTEEWPVWVVGYNARGRIDKSQMKRLADTLSKSSPGELVIVTLHHHPIVVPDMVSRSEDYFLSLDEAAGRQLIALCATSGVSAILHGHFHQFSKWRGSVPRGTTEMQIIGAPSGTMGTPGLIEQFLELREASRTSESGDTQGLALYLCKRKPEGGWEDVYQSFIAPAAH